MGVRRVLVVAELALSRDLRRWKTIGSLALAGLSLLLLVLMAIVIALTVVQFRYVERKVQY